jgi:glycerate dehydrogenase
MSHAAMSVKIVVLDGYTLNPGDLSWDALKALGELTVHDRTAPEEIVDRAKDAEIVLTNKTRLNREVIRKLPRARYVGVLATGYDVVNLHEAGKRGIVVTNVPDYASPSVAQHVFALILDHANHVGLHAHSVRKGDWPKRKDFSYWIRPIEELEGRTFGIVGLGRIGMRAARIAQSFGMRVIAYSDPPPSPAPEGIALVGLDDLFAQSDILSLHCPLTPTTEHLVNAERLARMKPTAWLVNTARGALVDEEALASALNENRLACALLDVLTVEPPDKRNPLLKAKNCWITPHQSWASQAARRRLMAAAVENLRAFLNGRPINVVNAADLALAAPPNAGRP